MQYISVKNKNYSTAFRNAVFQSVADDGSLLMPATIPQLSKQFIDHLSEYTLNEIAFQVLNPFIDDIPQEALKNIINKSFTFSIPIKKLQYNLFLLELFHGPTLAFKDVGARFMAETVGYYLKNNGKKITIIVATSGDTGSAVAHGFYNIPNIDVFILYPSKKITLLQEKQITTLGGNIHAIEVNGTFDDCQLLVKQSLMDDELKKIRHLITANSINIGRLLPQIVYYWWGIAQLRQEGINDLVNIVVPSGNFGNVTAAALAKKMGAPVHQLIAPTNTNAIVPQFLETGHFQSQPSHKTPSNAMDVGNPSNFERLNALYDNDINEWRKAIKAIAVTDDETLAEIKTTYQETNFLPDPHTAVGIVGAKRLADLQYPTLVAATAQAGKFPEIIKQALGFDMNLPDSLQAVMTKEKMTKMMEPNFAKWKRFLMHGE